MENVEKTNNFKVLRTIFRKYIILILVLSVALSGILIYKISRNKGMYTLKNVVQVNDDNIISNKTIKLSDIQSSDKFNNAIIAEDKFNEIYKKYKSSNDVKDKVNWIKSQMSVVSADDNNAITYTISGLNRDDAKVLSELYIEKLNSTYKENKGEYYKKEVEFLNKKIELMKKQIIDLGLDKDPNAAGVYNESISELANATVFLSDDKGDKFIKEDITETVTTVGKKQYLIAAILGIGAGVFISMFIGVFIEYLKDRRKAQ